MKRKTILFIPTILIMLSFLSGCGNFVVSQEPQTSITDEIEQIGQSQFSGGIPLTLDEVLERAIYPLAVAEIEIIDTIPRETYDKYEHELLFDMSYYVFYNAKITVYYTDDNFKNSEYIVFRHGLFNNELKNYNSGDQILCTLMSNEEIYGDNYKNVYNATSIFDIENVDNTNFVIRKAGAKENLFDLELSSVQKENIVSKINEVDLSNSKIDNTESDRFGSSFEMDFDESENYIAYYDEFKDALVNYVQIYRENEKKVDGDFNAIQTIVTDENEKITETIESDNDETIETTKMDKNEDIIETTEVNENE